MQDSFTGYHTKRMERIFLLAGVSLLAFMVPVLWRVIVGPTAIDRIVAVNIMGTKAAVLLVVIGAIFERVEMFIDFALAYALLNFLGSLAAAKYLHRTRHETVAEVEKEVGA
jgi:multicomponent Na+:H+ antiporter subunit F